MSRSQQLEQSNQPDNYRNRNNNNRGIRLGNPSIRDYFQEEDEMNNVGYIDERKLSENIRILSLNPNGCRPNDMVKMNHLKSAIQKYDLDILMLTETNTKWNTVNISRMERKMK